MKRKLVSLILGMAAVGAVYNASNTVVAQGLITLDSYLTSPGPGNYPLVTFGAGSGGTLGAGIGSAAGYTVGLYFSAAPINAVATTSGNLDTSIPTGTLATGLGSTALFGSLPGLFSTSASFNTGLAAGPINFVVVAYNGASYETSLVRGHSASFTLTTSAAPPIPGVGGAPGPMGTFAVVAVPEPSTFALAGLGLASLLIFRRRK